MASCLGQRGGLRELGMFLLTDRGRLCLSGRSISIAAVCNRATAARCLSKLFKVHRVAVHGFYSDLPGQTWSSRDHPPDSWY